MFKVECPGCQAPYQVDERRVPATGLGMRCPKCGTSFTVNRPEAILPTLSSAVAPAVPSAGPNAPSTVTGVAPGRKPSAPKMTSNPDLPDIPSRAAEGLPMGAESGLPMVRQGPGRAQQAADKGSLDFELGPMPGKGQDIGLPAVAQRKGAAAPAAKPRLSAEPMFDEMDFQEPQGLSLPPGGRSAQLPAVGGKAAARDLPELVANLKAGAANLPAPALGGLPEPAGGLPEAAGGLPETAGWLPDAPGGLPDLSAGGLPEFELHPPQAAAHQAHVATTLSDFSPPNFDAGGAGGDPFATDGDDPFATGPDPFANPEGDPFASRGGSGQHATAKSAADPFSPPGTVVYANVAPQAAANAFAAAPATEHEFDRPSAFDTGSPNEVPDFGTEADPFAGAAQVADPFAGGAERSAFDTAAGENPFGAAPQDDPFVGAERSAFDTAAGIGTLPHASVAPAGLGGPGQGAFGESAAAAEVRVNRQAGGADYGEVDLGGGESDSVFGSTPVADDGMEFGGVPQEETAAPAPGDASAMPAMHARMAIGAMPEIETDRQRRKKRRVRVAIAVTFIVMVAGGSLTLIPGAGPFGAFFILDRVKRGSNEQFLARTQARINELRGLDEFKEVTPMVEEATQAAEHVPRFKALASYAAFVRYWVALRFGPLPEMEAKAKVLLNELEEDEEVPGLALAQAAQALVEGNLAKARQFLEHGDDQDPDLMSLRGELGLRAREFEKAEQVWSAFFAQSPTAQSAYGLARSVLARGDEKRALELSQKAIELSPTHLDARILIARLLWSQNDEPKALEALDYVVERGAEASPGVMIAARTWLGNIHLLRGRFSQAEKAYDEALKINAKAGEALRGLGDTLYAAGRFSEALARFEAALEVEPDSLLAAVGVGKAKLALERLEEAKAHLIKLYETHATDMSVAYWYGQVEDALGNREVARVAYVRAIEMGGQRPDSVKAYVALASLQSQMGDIDGAQATLAAAQQKLPVSPELHKALGNLALSHGRFEAALEEFAKALTLDAKDIEARFAIGTTKRRMRLFEDALLVFDEVGKVDSNYPGFALERGLLFEEWGKIEDALKEYEAALAKAPNDVDVMLRVGCARVGAGYSEKAEEILRKVQNLRTQPAESSHCLGRALLLKGDLAESLRLLQRAVELSPKRAEYHLFLGWASNEAGRLADAEVAIKKALDLDKGLADAYWQRGVLRHKQGALQDAIEDLSYALKLRPSRTEAHAMLASVYYDLGQEQRALAEWATATAGRPNAMVWRFRYGKMLADNLRWAESIRELDAAMAIAKTEAVPPHWLWQAHLYLGRGLGMTPRAVEHWKAFLDQAPSDSPYIDEAKQALKRLGHPVR